MVFRRTAVKHNKFAVKNISGGKYICFTYKGDYKNLEDVYDQIFRDYIIPKKIILREEVIFDQLLNNFNNTATNELLTKIHIPIQ